MPPRLLARGHDGSLVFCGLVNEEAPAYAMLSHARSSEYKEEVGFQDVEMGTGKSKAGWKKIEFCADRASVDGLRYFWVDTCCI